MSTLPSFCPQRVGYAYLRGCCHKLADRRGAVSNNRSAYGLPLVGRSNRHLRSSTETADGLRKKAAQAVKRA